MIINKPQAMLLCGICMLIINTSLVTYKCTYTASVYLPGMLNVFILPECIPLR